MSILICHKHDVNWDDVLANHDNALYEIIYIFHCEILRISLLFLLIKSVNIIICY
jgi:hypothetical protein